MKRCPRCLIERPLEDFPRDASKASGRSSRCRACDNARSRAHHAAKRADKLRKCKCGRPTTSPRHHYCDRCRAVLDARRRARKRSGRRRDPLAARTRYGSAHQRRRREWAQRIAAGGVPCARCHKPITPGERWHLDHDDNDPTRYLGPSHAGCNCRAGAFKVNGGPRKPRTSTERGYGTEHQKLRRRYAVFVEAGGVKCARCGEPIAPGSRWELGHDDFDRNRYNGPEHFHCNRNAARLARQR